MTERPTVIILMGITGDLAQKKLLPAMYDLYVTGRLTNTKLVGFSRKEFTRQEIGDFALRSLPQNADLTFLDLITYVQGQFDDVESYKRLAYHLGDLDKEISDCSNKLFYLSVPPSLYETICTQIKESGLSIPCGGKDGFARILIEKPFGKDLETAIKLDRLLGELFQEEQIYRIDHYLAKGSILNILNIRRNENDQAKKWTKENVERIEVDLFETAVVGSRGATYDGVGALRDVGQNHMLQILALMTMDIPERSHPSDIQGARADILENLIQTSDEDLKIMKRGQYEGYLSESGVHPNSTTETFFSIPVRVKSGSLANVPFILRSGKALSENSTKIVITYKDQSNVSITIPTSDSLPAYQKILLDCILGDQTVFTSTREIMAEWNFITPIVLKVSNNQPFLYKIGSDFS